LTPRPSSQTNAHAASGRLTVSDIALKQPLPPEIGEDLMAPI
jgi:hypothetical protein